jgi:serine/threonine protein kinase
MARYKLGEYDIIKELGRGGMGVVYLAEHQRLKKEYAIKILPKKFARESELVQRFHTEARVMAELNHPNIVKVVNMSCEGTTYYLVMDYVLSETGSPKNLHDFVRDRGGKLPEEEAERIALEILSALEYAHSYSSKAAPSGIIHRDVKPANVLLDEKGTVKVTDFGLAKILGGGYPAATKRVTLTAEGVVMGTYDFMSPEQKEGKPADARSDLYAVGVIIYSMLTGKKPEGRFLLPSGIKPKLSKKWDIVVDKCLQNMPENRFQSAHEVIKVIKSKETIKLGKEEKAKEPGKVKKPKKEKKAHRRWFVELIRYTSIIIIVSIIAGAFLAYLLFKDKDIMNMIKASISTSIKEDAKEGKKESAESVAKKAVLAEEPTEKKTPGEPGAIKVPPVVAPEPEKERREISIKIPAFDKLVSDDFMKALREAASTMRKEGFMRDSKEFQDYYNDASDDEKLALDILFGLGNEFMESLSEKPEETLKQIPGLMEAIKERIPPEGPLRDRYESAVDKMAEAKKHRDAGDLKKSQDSYRDAQKEIRRVFVLQSARKEADKAKATEENARIKAIEALPAADENALYRMATKTGKDADNAYQKGDYARARTLYTIAGNVFDISNQDCKLEECVGILQKYVAKTKAEADQLNASSLARMQYTQANRLEKRANSAFENKSFRNAATLYVESVFFYERAKETILRQRVLKEKRR